MILSSDLHIHSCFSRATSKNMVIDTIAPQAKLKGLDLVGTGDAFHFQWLQMIKNYTKEIDEGIYALKDSKEDPETGLSVDGCNFILTSEVEDRKRVHHLIILPSIESAQGIREELKANNIDSDGRPRVRMTGAEIMDVVYEFDGLIGPSHAFTPWTSLYKEYESVYDCYTKKPDFLELGLSADTDMADRIEELQDIPFLSNSDAHSPWPHRLGREFNEIEVKNLNFRAIKDAISKKRIKANYGFDPRLGKYHKTACTRCYKVFDIEDALGMKMKCPCGGTIKKGVDYRIYELSTWNKPHHPPHRPPYIHILPLAEIISLVYGKGVTTVFIQNIWKELVQKFKSEINVLIYASLNEIEEIDQKLAEVIRSFRNKTLYMVPGGGGRYGKILFEEPKLDEHSSDITTLDSYFK
ncbi:MAG: TIGR00375 family protein [Euryarchaeota archaeon]|nr:TIGR00375 family protein [Euryarchaeota archaeon]